MSLIIIGKRNLHPFTIKEKWTKFRFVRAAEHLGTKLDPELCKTHRFDLNLGDSLSLRRSKEWHDSCQVDDDLRVNPTGKIKYLVHYLDARPNDDDRTLCVFWPDDELTIYASLHVKGECPHCQYRDEVEKLIEVKGVIPVKLKFQALIKAPVDGIDDLKEVLKEAVKRTLNYDLDEWLSEMLYDEDFEPDEVDIRCENEGDVNVNKLKFKVAKE